MEMTDLKKQTSKQLAALSKYVGLGVAIVAELLIGFRFDIGVILAIGVVNYCIEALTSSQ